MNFEDENFEDENFEYNEEEEIEDNNFFENEEKLNSFIFVFNEMKNFLKNENLPIGENINLTNFLEFLNF